MPKIRSFLNVASSAFMSISIYLFSHSVAFAQTTTRGKKPLLEAPSGSVGSNIKVESIPQLIVNWTFTIAIFLAVVYLMFGGIKLITSKGDKQAVESARKHITYAVLGLVVVAGTFFLLNVLFNVLGADNPLKNGFELPTLKNIKK